MKISSTVEQIFAHAVAMEQSGGLRNTIYAIDDEVFILGYDHTVLLRFKLRKSEAPFAHPVSFRANDYDSQEFYEENGKIIFVQKNGEYTRVKSCGTPDMTPVQVRELFHKLNEADSGFVTVQLDKNILPLLDRSLSHTEFVGAAGEPLKLIQRNIYSGSVIEVVRESGGGLLGDENLEDDIEPIAIKTPDLMALFAFQDVLRFQLPALGAGDYIKVDSIHKQKRDMVGVVACCIYDEIIEIKEATHGGQEQKVRRRRK
ncbi:MAG: hypothetical protein WC992_03570 [Acholeplasmataceae bacterium]|jgi:hypothetical protein